MRNCNFCRPFQHQGVHFSGARTEMSLEIIIFHASFMSRIFVAASSLLAAMDRTADPCKDFFQFACGTWNKMHVIPEDRSSISTFEVGITGRLPLLPLHCMIDDAGGITWSTFSLTLFSLHARYTLRGFCLVAIRHPRPPKRCLQISSRRY